MELNDDRRITLRKNFEKKFGIPPQITIDPKNFKEPTRGYMAKYTHDLELLLINERDKKPVTVEADLIFGKNENL